MKYFKNVKSYKNLKLQYKDLLKANHPDNGGDVEKMQEINVEYEALFKIWKDKAIKENKITEEEKAETASSTKRHFYTAFGWEGSRYDCNLSLKEIAKIVRAYVKEKYPTTKWSIRTHYASMCQSLSVDLLEFPEQMYMSVDDLRNYNMMETKSYERNGETYTYEDYTQEMNELLSKLHRNGFLADSYYKDDIFTAYEKALEENASFYSIKTEYFTSVIDDVNAFVASYNYNDSDGMIDYFDVNFYDGKVDFSSCKYVPKVARIKNQDAKPAKTEDTTENTSIEKSEDNFTVEESEHTKTHEKIYLVKCIKTLSREEYINVNNQIKKIGGYYSKFTHSFIFKDDPTEHLKDVKIA